MNVNQALSLLKEEGYKFTGKREQMLSVFAEESRYLSAKEVLTALQTNYPNVSFDTVYRNLSLFEEMEILEVTELDGERRFRFHCSTNHHHHHLICLDCGKTKQVDACPMEWISDNNDEEFEVTGHKFEVYGYCSSCTEGAGA
ncbi:Fur family transcriptional regulator [Salibacterium halotolerans]|uniref:Fur family transcriptional regulator, zinc uptake regulator n=1 Tax=Salibacterium halotolerans TaxID=1884432 RepID=A0A1I5NIU0_9BACI|nr:Fur family transcriptional regulator [Salibacterium halotolerans]SFP21632.1 Fur family transcriptional regulator, zinc uptake regulator [Salibacterium halotolerans]